MKCIKIDRSSTVGITGALKAALTFTHIRSVFRPFSAIFNGKCRTRPFFRAFYSETKGKPDQLLHGTTCTDAVNVAFQLADSPSGAGGFIVLPGSHKNSVGVPATGSGYQHGPTAEVRLCFSIGKCRVCLFWGRFS